MKIKECITKQTPKTIEKINTSYSEDKLTKEQLEEQIILNFVSKSITLTDKELKCLYDLKENKKLDKIEKYLINMGFIYKIKDEYILPEEISMFLEALNNPKSKKERLSLIVSFYITSNGILEINKLVELINKSGIKTTKEEVIKCAKQDNFIIENKKIYLDENIKKDEKALEDYVKSYKVFDLKEILNIIKIKETYLPQELKRRLNNKLLENVNINSLINYIIFSMSLGVNNEEIIEPLLKNKTIKLTKKEKEELLNFIENISDIIPKWIYGGYSFYEILNLKEERERIIKELVTSDNVIDILEEIYNYILSYLNINGVIDINTLLDILNNYNGFNFKKNDILTTIKDDDYIKLYKNYLNIVDNDKETIAMLLTKKQKYKEYKIIDDPEEILEEFDKNYDELEILLKKYKITGEAKEAIISIISFENMDQEKLQLLLGYFKINISKKDLKLLSNELSEARKQMRCWDLNGFKPSEINNKFNKKEKIGRNDMCPCGSGLKYKKCCGK